VTGDTRQPRSARDRERVLETIEGGAAKRPVRDTPPTRWDHYRALLEAIPAITYVQRVGDRIETIYVSPQVETIVGWTPDGYRAFAADWFAPIHPDDRAQVRAAVAAAVSAREVLDVEYRVVAPSGTVVWVRDQAAFAKEADDGAQLWQGVQIDITADKAAEQRLHHLAFYDALTGLPNRRLCLDRLRAMLDRPASDPVALLFLDLDRFKVINDGIGHAAGDELLAAVAERLTPLVAAHGSLGRYGGDEFVAILDRFAELSEVATVAASLVDALRRPFLVRGYELVVEGTVGIAVASPALATPEALLRAADVALYRAKASGGSTFAVFDPAIDHGGLARLEHEADLRRALEAREFEIAYQPVVDIASGQILAVEALLRWNHPRRGVLPPAEFIDLADETGVIVPLGKWVIEEASRQVRAWQDRYPAARGLQLSVNLSSRQFQAALVADVAAALERSGLSPASLALELTEGDVIARVPTVATALHELKRLGVKVTIDDFGAGWSALTSLTDFTVDDLKIDGSRVSRLGQQPQDVDVVRALVGMAKAVGMDVTAEAVETGEQLALLRELGCDRAQGHHFSPPLFVAEIEALLARESGLGNRTGDEAG
jgi:diguanylate cyclase (GGDEF)-like protein/PAS domain S-box-containing protein